MRALVLGYLLAITAYAQNLTYTFDANRITALTYLETDFAQVSPNQNFIGTVLHNGSGSSSTCTRTTALNANGWTQHCNDGSDKHTQVDAVLSQPDSDSLKITVTVANKDDIAGGGDDTITRVDINPLEITNPGVNLECDGVPRQAGRRHKPSYTISGDWGSWGVGLLEFPENWRIWVGCGGTGTVNFDIALQNYSGYNAIEDEYAPIAPGESVTIDVVIRFGPAGASRLDLNADSYEAWRSEMPYVPTWKDPRSITAFFLASDNLVSESNPRGWTGNITDWTDKAAFVSRWLSGIDFVINVSLGLDPNAQGILFWDIEGNEFVHSLTYVGDPTAICPGNVPDDTSGITPEMCYDIGTGKQLVDEMMDRVHAAGLRVGFTLRPQAINYGTTKPSTCLHASTPFNATSSTADYTDIFIDLSAALWPRANRGCRCNDTGDGWVCPYGIFWQRHLNKTQDNDPIQAIVDELARKIRYAVSRWRASFFYVDTNNLGGTYPPEIFYQLAQEFPDVLLLPEWEFEPYAGSTFPYGELDLGELGATAREKDLYPQARRVLNIMDGNRTANADNIIAVMREGSPTIHNAVAAADYTDTQTFQTQARALNGVVTLSTGESYSTTIPIVERVRGSCYPHELVVRFASSTEVLNACNPLLEQGCGSTTLCRSMDSPCTVADRTVYRHEIHSASQQACSVGAVIE